MRKLIGLCFLTATLIASSASAQGILIEKGDPSAVGVLVGGGLVKDAWGAGLTGGYSYRGVVDFGAEFTRYAYTGGNNNKLAGYSLTPYLAWNALRHDVDELPLSASVSLGVQKIFYTGNTPVTNPEGWSVIAGISGYRRFEIGTSFVLIPEIFLGYQFKYTRYYSEALDQTSSNTRRAGEGYGYTTEGKNVLQAVFRPNIVIKKGSTQYVIIPYGGFAGGLVAGGNIGAMF
jgi:hypothetical protein